MSEWDNIQGVEGWRKKLKDLLAEAEAISQNQDIQARLALSKRFVGFIINSHPSTEEIKVLDQIAEKARSGIMKSAIEDRLAAISERSGELARLTKEFQANAADAKASAASIRLTRAGEVVGTLTNTVKGLQELRGSLQAGTDAQLAQSIEKMITSIDGLQSEVKKIL